VRKRKQARVAFENVWQIKHFKWCAFVSVARKEVRREGSGIGKQGVVEGE
jgi:hypothetical protein